MSELQKKIQMNKLPPMPVQGLGGGSSGNKRGFVRRRDYSPVTWDKYFEKMDDIKINDENTFRVYQCGTQGPVCLFLHGGGFSALSWAVLSKTLTGLVTCRCAAVDLRGHGDTSTADETNMSADCLASDVGDVVRNLYGEDPPPIILVGHSMGGAIAVHVAAKELVPSLIGLAVIDVVEGTALEALNSMQSFLRGRPSHFKSLEHAIEWCVRSGQIRNLESAKVSVVGQLKRIDTNETATSIIGNQSSDGPAVVTNADTIVEEEEDEEGVAKRSKPQQSASSTANHEFKHPSTASTSENKYTWRIDLSSTEKFWRGWFEGLSQLFLSCNVAKMLLLAGVDRLDKDLTVGQMQGKFQMQVLPQCGHAVHEDVPEKVADVLATFMVRHRVAEPLDTFQRTFPAC